MTRRLSAFLIVSCLTHAALLWLQRPLPPAPLIDIGGEARALRVSLLAGSAQATPAGSSEGTVETAEAGAPAPAAPPTITAASGHKRPAPAVVAARPKTPPPVDSRAVVPRVDRTPAAAARARATDDPTPPQPAAGGEPRPSSTEVGERVSAALQRELSEAFDYPWLARKRGWQGMVTLSLHISGDGALTRWRVERTSGYSVLDRSALKAARSIRRLPQAERLLDGRPIDLAVPVHYRLLDG